MGCVVKILGSALFLDGLVVMIRLSHSRERGSIPRRGKHLTFWPFAIDKSRTRTRTFSSSSPYLRPPLCLCRNLPNINRRLLALSFFHSSFFSPSSCTTCRSAPLCSSSMYRTTFYHLMGASQSHLVTRSFQLYFDSLISDSI